MARKKPLTEEHLAARAVAIRPGLSLQDRLELLDMLGLYKDPKHGWQITGKLRK